MQFRLLSRAVLSAVAIAAFTLPVLAQGGPIGFSVRSNADDHLLRIDLLTGVATDLGLVNFGDAEGMAFVGTTLVGIGGSVLEYWDLTTPPGALIGATGGRNGTDAGLATDPTTGIVYNINGSGGSGTLYRIQPNGTAVLIGGDAIFADSLGINAAGQAFATDAIFTDSLYSVNLATGGKTLIGALNNPGLTSEQTGMDFDSAGNLWLIDGGGEIYLVNTATGQATFVAQTTLNGNAVGGTEGLAIQGVGGGQAAPEPATLALLTLGGMGLLARRRK